MDALFGKAQYLQSMQRYTEAMEALNLLVVSQPDFAPPLLAKVKVHLAGQNWDQTLEATNR